jgi:hypothetical protein
MSSSPQGAAAASRRYYERNRAAVLARQRRARINSKPSEKSRSAARERSARYERTHRRARALAQLARSERRRWLEIPRREGEGRAIAERLGRLPISSAFTLDAPTFVVKMPRRPRELEDLRKLEAELELRAAPDPIAAADSRSERFDAIAECLAAAEELHQPLRP